jgi:predicted nuclease of restriction endonuclease-like RecB superfamily
LKKKLRNKFEDKLYRRLKRAKVRFKYEALKIPYILARHYIPDFIIETPTGQVLIEAKGYFRPEAKAKMLAVKKLNPQLDIRLVFYSANPKQIRWAEKNGFRYAVGDIPTEWLLGL